MNTVVRLRPCVTTTHLHSRLLSIKRATSNAQHCTFNLTKSQASRRPSGDFQALLRVKSGNCVGTNQPVRYIAEWDTIRSGKGFTKVESIVVCFSLGTFMLYFMYLREGSDIDEYMSQPIWKRVPGIDPERAEQMMLVDKHFGLQVDYTELEQYKRDYYAKQSAELVQERRNEQKHQELLQGKNPHHAMLLKYAQSPDVRTDYVYSPENKP